MFNAMKKIFSFVIVLAAVTMVGCCGNSNKKAAEATATEAACCAEKCDSTEACCAEKCDSACCAEKCDSTKTCCKKEACCQKAEAAE